MKNCCEKCEGSLLDTPSYRCLLRSCPCHINQEECKRCKDSEKHGHCTECGLETTPVMKCKCEFRKSLRLKIEGLKQNEEFAEHDLELAKTPNVIKLLAKQVGRNQAVDEVLELLS